MGGGRREGGGEGWGLGWDGEKGRELYLNNNKIRKKNMKLFISRLDFDVNATSN